MFRISFRRSVVPYVYCAARFLLVVVLASATSRGATVVGTRGPLFTLNGQPTYTAATRFGQADPNIAVPHLNVRALHPIVDDRHYPRLGSRNHPSHSTTRDSVPWDDPPR